MVYMQMPKHYEDEELVVLLDTYLQQSPNNKYNFDSLSLFSNDYYRAEYILKWIYDESEFWDSIGNNLFEDIFNAVNKILIQAKSQQSYYKIEYMQTFASKFQAHYFNAEYFTRKHILLMEDMKELKGQKTLTAFIKKHEKILGELENKYQITNTENTNQINALINQHKDTFKAYLTDYTNIRNKNITDFDILIQDKTTTFEELKIAMEAKASDLEITNKNAINNLEEFRVSFDTLYDDKKARLENITNTYHEKLKLEGPAKYFKDESDDYKKIACHWLWVFCIIFGVIILGLILSITFKYPNFSNILYLIDLFKIMPYITISTLSLLFLIFCGNRYLESKHLHNEMKQKSTLVSAYLAIYKDLENNEDTKVLINTKAKLLENIFSVSRYSKKGGMITNDALEIIKAINAK